MRERTGERDARNGVASGHPIGSSDLLDRMRRFIGSGFGLAVLANLLWGASFLASKYTLQVWGPFTASALRFLIALLAMRLFFPLLGLSVRLPRSKESWTQVCLVGITGFGILYPLQLGGLKLIPSSLSAAIMLTSPLFVILLSSRLFRESLSTQKVIAIGVGMLGGVMLVSPASLAGSAWNVGAVSQLLKGTLLTLGASVMLAISVLASRSASKSLDSPSLTFWSMLIGTIVLLPFAALEPAPVQVRGSMFSGVIALVFLAVVCSVVAYLVWNRALKLTTPQDIASTMHIKTPVAVVLGVLIAGEPLTASIIIGTSLVSFAVWLSQQSPSRLLRMFPVTGVGR